MVVVARKRRGGAAGRRFQNHPSKTRTPSLPKFNLPPAEPERVTTDIIAQERANLVGLRTVSHRAIVFFEQYVQSGSRLTLWVEVDRAAELIDAFRSSGFHVERMPRTQSTTSDSAIRRNRVRIGMSELPPRR
jgi:hypothetical protein